MRGNFCFFYNPSLAIWAIWHETIHLQFRLWTHWAPPRVPWDPPSERKGSPAPGCRWRQSGRPKESPTQQPPVVVLLSPHWIVVTRWQQKWMSGGSSGTRWGQQSSRQCLHIKKTQFMIMHLFDSNPFVSFWQCSIADDQVLPPANNKHCTAPSNRDPLCDGHLGFNAVTLDCFLLLYCSLTWNLCFWTQ